VELQIGSKGITFELLIDTGSNDLWVASSLCRSCYDLVCTPCSKTQLGPEDTTLNNTGQGFAIPFGSSGYVVAGDVVTDTVSVGGLTLVMSFGLATTILSVSVRLLWGQLIDISLSMA